MSILQIDNSTIQLEWNTCWLLLYILKIEKGIQRQNKYALTFWNEDGKVCTETIITSITNLQWNQEFFEKNSSWLRYFSDFPFSHSFVFL